jgi:hypothetical protein
MNLELLTLSFLITTLLWDYNLYLLVVNSQQSVSSSFKTMPVSYLCLILLSPKDQVVHTGSGWR